VSCCKSDQYWRLLEMLPVNKFESNWNTVTFVQYSITGGRVELRKLYDKLRPSKFSQYLLVDNPKLPLMKFEERTRDVSLTRPTRLRGSTPLRRLLFAAKISSVQQLPNAPGISPLKKLLLRKREVKAGIFPRQYGISPVK
jgi:hypothetical protein